MALFLNDTMLLPNSNVLQNFSENATHASVSVDKPQCTIEDNGVCYPSWEIFLEDVRRYLIFKPHEWVFIFIFIIVFFIGAIGNFLVCYVVLHTRKMRTVTNVFIFNLSLSDFLVIIFCLPTTAVEDVYETWFLGMVMCKILKYLQRVSVYVSVITLTTISIDRCRAIASPFRAKLSVGSAVLVIGLIWVVAMGSASPDLVLYRTEPTFRPENVTVLMTMCGMEDEKYEGEHLPLFWVPLTCFFILPLLIMLVAYSITANILWHRDASLQNGQGVRSDSQLHRRRKTAKMLIVVVVFFCLCYLPVHVHDFLRYLNTFRHINQDVAMVLFMISHLLVYINSSLNPVIYMFMSATFRNEFKSVLRSCCFWKTKRAPRSCERIGSRTRDTITVTAFTGNGIRKEITPHYAMILTNDI